MEAMTDRPFQVMAKPIGPRCNLDCKYCYYLEKEKLYPETKKFEMQPDLISTPWLNCWMRDDRQVMSWVSSILARYAVAIG